METKLFVATKAFILHQGKVLLLQESTQYADGANAGKFDLAGGRIKPGQRFDESLKREVREETGLKIKIGRPFFVSEWRPVVRKEQWQIVGIFFICHAKTDKVVLSKDHAASIWINPGEYKKQRLIENLKPVFSTFLKNNSG